MFSPVHKLYATLSGRLRQMTEVPVEVLTSLIANTMGLDYRDLKRPTSSDVQQPHRKCFALPSESKAEVLP